jgi:ubiquinone/menaquinone biosynthesis C-methylase UbiE
MKKGFNRFKTSLDNHDFMTPDDIAGFLRNHRTGTDNIGRQALAEIVRQYEDPMVVDAACGTCVNWEVFKARGVKCDYYGVDRTIGMIERAQELYGDEICVVHGYVQQLPVEDGEADIVIMRHILEHLQEGYEDAIREGLRVASKELVLVFFLDLGRGDEDKIEESEPDENGCTYFWNTYSHPKLMKFLSEFGCQLKVSRWVTPGAAHADTILRIIK